MVHLPRIRPDFYPEIHRMFEPCRSSLSNSVAALHLIRRVLLARDPPFAESANIV
jgi:hypothetical protein